MWVQPGGFCKYLVLPRAGPKGVQVLPLGVLALPTGFRSVWVLPRGGPRHIQVLS